METPRPEDALDFLNNYSQKRRGPAQPLRGKRLAMFIGLVAGVLLIVWAILALMFGGNGLKDDLLRINAQQEDMVRWTKLGTKNARSTSVLNNSLIMNQFLTTDSKDMRTYILKTLKDKKVDSKVSALSDEDTDDILDSAKSNNRFDDDFKKVLTQKITTYTNSLMQARNKSKDANLDEILDRATTNIKTITF